MSYDISSSRINAAARADQTDMADMQREDFLRRLDDAADEVNVTDFEGQILASFLSGKWFWTGPRRHVVDEMMVGYRHRLPAKSAKGQVSSVRIPESEPGKCCYLVRGLAGQVRCGMPATKKNSDGAEFCDAHWDTIVQWQERRRQMKARRA